MNGGLRSTSSSERAPVLVLALGGNAITRAGDPPTVRAQFDRTRHTAELLLPIIAAGEHRLVITHGNGPQVGNILLRSDVTAETGQLPRIPIDAAVADTQGAMGYMIQQCLSNALWESGIRIPVVTVVTQVIVEENDPAFQDPTKPIGRYYSDADADRLRAEHGWTMKKDPHGRGWRRVVPSPIPREIVEQDVVNELVDDGVIVIACGGGGVPVVAGEGGSLEGVEAVIDKDLASSLLATHVRAATFAIATEVENVFVDYGAPEEKALGSVDVDTLRTYKAKGHFAPGSMLPKVEAAIGFVDRGGEHAVITTPDALGRALSGDAGTHVTPTAASAALGT